MGKLGCWSVVRSLDGRVQGSAADTFWGVLEFVALGVKFWERSSSASWVCESWAGRSWVSDNWAGES